jgi:prolyl-tRNA synthetase
LEKSGIEPLLDDRDERPGVKFKDADLLGIPLQVIVGKNTLKDGTLELKTRRDQEKIIKPKEEILREIEKLING